METTSLRDWKALAQSIIKGREITYNEALQLLYVPDEEVLEVMNAAYLIRHHHYGKK